MAAQSGMIERSAVRDGVLVVMKESGWTSHDVVAKIRSLLGGPKVGHAGTLDPAATGVLPVLIGRATRVAEYLVEWDKEYQAVLRLGETTDTQDATGIVLRRQAVDGLTDSSVQTVIEQFRGAGQQVPPMYSAVKVGGRALYKAARSGHTIERQARPVVIHRLEMLEREGRDVTLRIVCSKGTYIRTLCEDIGNALGVGGHMLSLVRLRVGPLSIDNALTVGEIADQAGLGKLDERLVSIDRVLEPFPEVVLTDERAARVRHGAPVHCPDADGLSITSPSPVRLKDLSGALLAIGTYDPTRPDVIKIAKVLAVNESLH
jgi:tRNA pseudouridine55 synthase